jgi:hypothetical protein
MMTLSGEELTELFKKSDRVDQDFIAHRLLSPLAPLKVGNLVFGVIDEVNGAGAREKDTRISKFEAGLLVRHWAKKLWDIKVSAHF